MLASVFFILVMWISRTLASSSLSSSGSNGVCPKVCFCNTPSKIVYCSRRGLTSIPDGIPTNALQLNLNGNAFESGIIRRSNISRFVGLEHLYMSECQLESIEVGSFADLVNLRWLDLSNNRLKVIEEFTFRGLSLQHLFLNGNRKIRLLGDSFEGLSTNGLYLHDCSLSEIHLEELMPLNSTLRYLWLNGNELEKIDVRFLALFSGFIHLRLGSNPLHCNCQTVWLKEFYDKNGYIFKGAMPPSCLAPIKLRGRFFNELTLFDFRCQTPMFSRIEAHFASRQGRIKCAAVGEPAPSLYWIQPSGKTTKFSPMSSSEEADETEAVLHLNWEEEDNNANPSGMYICIANNEAGNVTLTVNVPWPQRQRTPSSAVDGYEANDVLVTWPPLPPLASASPSSRPLKPPVRSDLPMASNIQYRLLGDSLMLARSSPGTTTRPPSGSIEEWLAELNYTSIEFARHRISGGGGGRNQQRLFSASELACAVIGTHLSTLVLCLVSVVLFYRTPWRKCPSPSRSNYDQSLDHRGPLSSSYGSTGPGVPGTGVCEASLESVYLNGVKHHPLKSYVETPDATIR